MQQFGIGGMFSSALSMFLLYASQIIWAQLFFGASLITILVSLALCSYEIYLSNKALMVQLSDIEKELL